MAGLDPATHALGQMRCSLSHKGSKDHEDSLCNFAAMTSEERLHVKRWLNTQSPS
jgi:hypothetical protein